MRSKGGVRSCFPTHDALKPRLGWGTHSIDMNIVGGNSIDFCASLRGRGGWRWELFSI